MAEWQFSECFVAQLPFGHSDVQTQIQEQTEPESIQNARKKFQQHKATSIENIECVQKNKLD